ncbi:hypothetical protein RJ55_02788 [Drechmeria coniospora]|nr:hypothetical protein RJ55_02788 [Drechmeria coniospora]
MAKSKYSAATLVKRLDRPGPFAGGCLLHAPIDEDEQAGKQVQYLLVQYMHSTVQYMCTNKKEKDGRAITVRTVRRRQRSTVVELSSSSSNLTQYFALARQGRDPTGLLPLVHSRANIRTGMQGALRTEADNATRTHAREVDFVRDAELRSPVLDPRMTTDGRRRGRASEHRAARGMANDDDATTRQPGPRLAARCSLLTCSTTPGSG